MKVTLNWLKQYVDVNWSPEGRSERFTRGRFKKQAGLFVPRRYC